MSCGRVGSSAYGSQEAILQWNVRSIRIMVGSGRGYRQQLNRSGEEFAVKKREKKRNIIEDDVVGRGVLHEDLSLCMTELRSDRCLPWTRSSC